MNPILIASIIAIYFAVLITISIITGRNADNDTFFRGNKQSPWYIVSIGMIGASLSGVTFISVPGWVGSTGMTYMQMVMGYFLGYLVIAHILLPLYYRLNLTSIYSYLEDRFGFWSYKSGAILFLLSRTIGAAARLYLVANVLQLTIFDSFNVPFEATVLVTILLIWLYTFKGGIKTIIWTDTLQTLFMLLSVGITVVVITKSMNLSFGGMISTIAESDFSSVFVFDDWASKQHFIKQFFSGAFITIVMTGLDQDMMQKNLTCRNLKDAQKNMHWYGFSFVPVNLLFLSLGVLLYTFAINQGIAIPENADDLFPIIATKGYLPPIVGIFFILGLVAAAYSSADSALTSLTTSFSVDIIGLKSKSEKKAKQIRFLVHIGFSFLLAMVILLFRVFNNDSIISTIFNLAGYTYGPLLGLYAFGLFTSLKVKDYWVPLVAIVAPVITGILDYNSIEWFGGAMGFEKLILNGLITFAGLIIITRWTKD
ncbi:sodium:solute symporter [Carboxylicivirga linearis]|uniref:Sodium:solute symporter n=1 Tax=Carboxylicivirga linearis TaxID=1628157 RepID=A0ABS5JSS5_9BACT|nr:sodium:solute symporter [Carboxylicivirga linearis]MBS2097912.1 sodium:solute symporter [Carboxylicivirga linearis]